MNRLQAQIEQINKTPGQQVDQTLTIKFKTAQTNCGARQSALQAAQQSYETEKARGMDQRSSIPGRVTATTVQMTKGKIEVKPGVAASGATTATVSSSSSPGTPITSSPAAVDVKPSTPAEVAPVSR